MHRYEPIFLLLMAAVVIVIGVKTIIAREATVSIQLWRWGNSNDAGRGGGYSESNQTGFVAVLVGLAEIGVGIGLLAKAFS